VDVQGEHVDACLACELEERARRERGRERSFERNEDAPERLGRRRIGWNNHHRLAKRNGDRSGGTTERPGSGRRPARTDRERDDVARFAGLDEALDNGPPDRLEGDARRLGRVTRGAPAVGLHVHGFDLRIEEHSERARSCE
jgi:hypothetical protein